MTRSSFILPLSEVDKGDISIAGTKGSYLGEMTRLGLPIPQGFVITSFAYFQFLQENFLIDKIKALLSTAGYQHPESLMQVSDHIKRLIVESPLPPSSIKDIDNAYRRLGGMFKSAEVALRPSITSEDLASAAFTGHLRTSLDVQGEANLLIKIKEAWASLFDAGALAYRFEHKIDHFRVGVGIVVQKMIPADSGGIILTTDPVTNDKSIIIIEASKEEETPDHYEMRKEDLSIIKKREFHKKINQNQITDLALLGKKIEQHAYFPQEIIWAIHKNNIYVIAVKPINTSPTNPLAEDQRTTSHLPLLLKGTPGGQGMTTGPVKVLTDAKNLAIVSHGDVLVLSEADASHLPAMKKASAIITDKGGSMSYAAHIARSLGIPAVVGTEHATKLTKGTVVTVNGSKGEVYKSGHHTYASHHTITQVFVDSTDPSDAATLAEEDVKGVVLLKSEDLSLPSLAHELETVCRAFSGRPVIYQAHNLDLLKKQCEAIKHVTGVMKLHNLHLLLPPVHTVRELMHMKQVMLDAGLHRSATFKLWMTITTPANALLLDTFISAGIDGVSIDIRSLTKHILGIDPDNSRTSHAFDELNPAVLSMIEKAIKTADKHHLHSLVADPAPILYPTLLEKLIHWGITTISVPTDDTETIQKNIMRFEREMVENRHSV